MFIGVATKLTERTPGAAGGGGRSKGTSLEQVAEQQQSSSWKQCGC